MSTELQQAPGEGRQAVVIGGSIAGLVTARVLADHFETVTIVERDRFATDASLRKGVPQGRQLHVLLVHGLHLLTELFPGLPADLAAAGAVPIDMAGDMAWLYPQGWNRRSPSAMIAYGCTRPVLESCIYTRVAAGGRVRFREACDVIGLAGSAGTVQGVQIRPRGLNAGPVETLAADLVVDASGRASRAPDWLEALGYARLAETVVNAFLGYATAILTLPADFQPPWKGLYVQSAPPDQPRGGILVQVEGGRWMICLVGMGRDYPPTDEAGFRAFARSLRSPALAEALAPATLTGPIAAYRATENRMRHFERLARWPDGFVVLGDAACCFNPVYGQGMTVAAVGANLLGAALVAQRRRRPDGSLAGLAPPFQRRLARATDLPWMMATGSDYRAPTTEGGRPGLSVRLLNAYLDRVMAAATRNPAVNRTLVAAMQLAAPPAALFAPSVLLPALFAGAPSAAPTAPALPVPYARAQL